MDNKL
jgi:hypothetical protein